MTKAEFLAFIGRLKLPPDGANRPPSEFLRRLVTQLKLGAHENDTHPNLDMIAGAIREATGSNIGPHSEADRG